MTFLSFYIGLLLGVGCYLVLADLLRLPSVAATRAARQIKRRNNPSVGMLDLWLSDLSEWLAKHLHIGAYRRAQLEVDIASAGLTLTPERHLANCIVKAGIVVLLVPFAWIVSPAFALLIAVIAVLLFVNESRKVSVGVQKKRKAIERELPRLVANISKLLIHTRNVLEILDRYRPGAGPELRAELDVTLADMRSGNHEIALTRMEARIGSAMVGDVTRGLIALIRGDRNDLYWASLSVKLSEYGRQELKAEAQKAPKKVHWLSSALMACFLLIYIEVFAVVIVSTLGNLL